MPLPLFLTIPLFYLVLAIIIISILHLKRGILQKPILFSPKMGKVNRRKGFK
ncbi:hypothetical protein X560_2739 [Listeria fleischmannii 1991]|uniref:Uncharacterized protein n=1 Tax=Listeria fleischmannii 1991 TaxID=1430899 RepID=A0A0J8J086_9LIST|nr:hypothetical protein X560_2739 [Listeria fleischmannii 1991]